MAQKAPGKHYREGISLVELTKMFPDDEAARLWIESIRWPEGPQCPHCGSTNIHYPVKHKTMSHRCRKCRKWFSCRTGTVMQNSKLGYQVWVFASYLMHIGLKGASSMKLHRDLEVTQKVAWHLAHRLRETWEDNAGSPLGGPVEIDETYMGGKRKNMPKSKRKMLTGRGAVGKTAVVGAKDRATNKVSAMVVQSTDAPTLHGFVGGVTSQDAQIYADDAAAYVGIDRGHESVNHSVGEYVRDMAHTNGMESHWATLKRGFNGIYHKMSPKHLHRYVQEFAGRHNDRKDDTIEQMRTMIANMEGRRLPYKVLKMDNGLSNGSRECTSGQGERSKA